MLFNHIQYDVTDTINIKRLLKDIFNVKHMFGLNYYDLNLSYTYSEIIP